MENESQEHNFEIHKLGDSRTTETYVEQRDAELDAQDRSSHDVFSCWVVYCCEDDDVCSVAYRGELYYK